MQIDEILREIERINQYLRTKKWCDFWIGGLGEHLEVNGSTSFSETPDLTIKFKSVFFVSCATSWSSDVAQEVIKVTHRDKAEKLNEKYKVEYGHVFFTIKAEDIGAEFYVSAQAIEVYIN